MSRKNSPVYLVEGLNPVGGPFATVDEAVATAREDDRDSLTPVRVFDSIVKERTIKIKRVGYGIKTS
jgi:hypothetical protein